tara:strand:+ start:39701 stop:40792 length:1092 start_codon:yes stop_codon:yes gene_type:complete
MKYDYLVIGAGMFGSVFARQAKDAGKKVLVIDKRNHIAGNCYTEKIKDIEVHKYGPHVFHTNNKQIWEYANRFTDFNHFTYRAKVKNKNSIYSFPINMMTFHQLWGVITPQEAEKKLEEVRVKIENPQNLEEWILTQVGHEVYETFIKGYTIKQWNRDPKDLPAFIIKRLPIRLTYDDNYFNDRYQGIPVGGYTKMFERILDGIEIQLNVDFFENKNSLEKLADKIVFTGKIDEYFGYDLGILEYRTINFDHRIMKGDYQGNAAINHTEASVKYTRTIEHKHFEFKKCEDTVVTFEYPDVWDRSKIPLYPVNNDKNNSLYKDYRSIAKNKCKNVLFGGRLAEYKYYDMHQVIGSALSKSKKLL